MRVLILFLRTDSPCLTNLVQEGASNYYRRGSENKSALN